MEHATHLPLAVAVHGERYWPTAHEEVSHATHEAPLLQYPAAHAVWQLLGSPAMPVLAYTLFGGRLVHPTHALFAVGVQTVAYWPIGHETVLQTEHTDPD